MIGYNEKIRQIFAVSNFIYTFAVQKRSYRHVFTIKAPYRHRLKGWWTGKGRNIKRRYWRLISDSLEHRTLQRSTKNHATMMPMGMS